MSIEVAVKNAVSMTGEGPFWEAETRRLVFVDNTYGGVHRWDSVTGQHEHKCLESSAGYIIPRTSGGYVVGLGRTLSHLDWDSGEVTTLAEVDLMGTKNRMNDAKCDANGRIWAGTMGYQANYTDPGALELGMGTLYSIDTDHSVRGHLGGLDISNGLAWTHDNQTLYFIDSIPKKLYAFDFDLENGRIKNQRVAVDFDLKGDEFLGLPDGMCIDIEEKLWVACYGRGKLVRCDPQTGNILRVIDMPVTRVTSCCFGGVNLDELFVTCGKAGLSEKEFKEEQPLAGSIFKITGLGVKGELANKYKG